MPSKQKRRYGKHADHQHRNHPCRPVVKVHWAHSHQETGDICKKAGADVLVAGSYIFNADNRKKVIDSLR